MIQHDKKGNLPEKEDDEPMIKPDPETLHTTDPQDHMEGPVSSLVNKTRQTMEKEQEPDEEEAEDEEKDGQ